PPLLPLTTGDSDGFYGWERRDDDSGRGDGDSWQWMGQTGHVTVRNYSGAPVSAVLEVELGAFERPRTLILSVAATEMQRLRVEPEWRRYALGPLTLAPGDTVFDFRALEPASRPDAVGRNGDLRDVTVGFRPWTWNRP